MASVYLKIGPINWYTNSPESFSLRKSYRLKDAFTQGAGAHGGMVNCFACMKVHSLEEAKETVMERAEDAEQTKQRQFFRQKTSVVYAKSLDSMRNSV